MSDVNIPDDARDVKGEMTIEHFKRLKAELKKCAVPMPTTPDEWRAYLDKCRAVVYRSRPRGDA
jgi:IS1 family transposase